MGILKTLERLRRERPERYRAYLEHALLEPHENVQRAAVQRLLSMPEAHWMREIVLHYGELLPGVRADLEQAAFRILQAALSLLNSPQVAEREAGASVLGRVATVSDIRHLIGAMRDVSRMVRESVVATISRLAAEYHTKLLRARSGDPDASVEAARDRGEALLMVEEMLRRYDDHKDSTFVTLAVEMGGDIHERLITLATERMPSPLSRDTAAAMSLSRSPECMRLWLELAGEGSQMARALFDEVLRRREDPSLLRELGAALRAQTPAEFTTLAAAFEDVPWWDRLSAAADVDADTVEVNLALLKSSRTPEATVRTRIRALLNHPSAHARAAALTTMEAYRSRDLAEIAGRMLDDPSDDVKAVAAWVLSREKVPGLPQRLAPHVRSTHPRLQAIAMKVITEASFERYIGAFDRLDEDTREAAARAISKLDASFIERLRAEVEGLDPDRRMRALRIAEYAHAEKELGAALRDVLQDPDVKLRATALKMLGVTGSAEGMRHLIEALNDPDRRIRANAVEAIEEIGDTRFTALLKPFLADPDNRVRGNTAKALWRLGVADGRSTLEAMLASEDRLMRLSGAWAMGEIGSREFEPVLRDRLAGEPDAQVRERILKALAELAEGEPR